MPKHPRKTEKHILDILNAAGTASEIAGRELRKGPVSDDRLVGRPVGYDVRLTVAQRILEKRAMLPGNKFTDLSQLRRIKGFGEDNFPHLLYACVYPGIYFQDTFSAAGLNSGYRKFPDEGGAQTYTIIGRRLRIWAAIGQDLWGGPPRKRGAPLLLYTAPAGNYAVECQVDATMMGARIGTQVGLFVFEDVENWLFFGFTLHSGQAGPLPDGDGLITTVTLADSSRISHYRNVPFHYDQHIRTLKIERCGDWFRFYSKARTGWYLEGPPEYAHFENHEVGMGVKSFQTGGTAQQGYFDNFIIRN